MIAILKNLSLSVKHTVIIVSLVFAASRVHLVVTIVAFEINIINVAQSGPFARSKTVEAFVANAICDDIDQLCVRTFIYGILGVIFFIE